MKTRQNTQGFTLIELMITLTLIGIMATIAMPSMSNFIANQRLANRITQVSTIFRFARTEAVRRNNPVLICGGITLKTDGKPNNLCGQNGNSLLAFVDKNNDNDYQSSITTSGSDIDLRSVLIDRDNIRIDILDTGLVLRPLLPSNRLRFIFQPNGTFGFGSASSGGSVAYGYTNSYVRISASDGKRVRMTLVAPSGRVITCNSAMTADEFNSLQPTSYKNLCNF